MQKTIHPKYYESTVSCACGNTFVVGSTKPSISVEICAKCHPFFTGEMRFVDTMGRVERFQQKMATMPKSGVPVTKKARQLWKKKQIEEEEAKRPKSLKEMLDKVKVNA